MVNQVSNAGNGSSPYRSLYKLGGAAALVAAVLILGVVVGYWIYPQPSTVSEWFELFQSSKLIGLLDFWGLEVLMYTMFVLVYLALYLALRETDPGRMVIAMTFALLGIGISLATNNPFTMLSLSDQYAAAATDTHRSMLLAAGQAVLANTGQRVVGGFNVGLFLVSVAGLTASAVMLKNLTFSRSTAYVGILAHTLSLVDYLRQFVTQSTIIALLVILPNALLTLVWFLLVGRRLLQIGHSQK